MGIIRGGLPGFGGQTRLLTADEWLSHALGPNELAKRVIGAALGTTTALSLILSPAIAASELVR